MYCRGHCLYFAIIISRSAVIRKAEEALDIHRVGWMVMTSAAVRPQRKFDLPNERSLCEGRDKISKSKSARAACMHACTRIGGAATLGWQTVPEKNEVKLRKQIMLAKSEHFLERIPSRQIDVKEPHSNLISDVTFWIADGHLPLLFKVNGEERHYSILKRGLSRIVEINYVTVKKRLLCLHIFFLRSIIVRHPPLVVAVAHSRVSLLKNSACPVREA